ncbi:hypothetical protein CRE_19099 [Caenorhabditis remanei]|uniref:Uncharacterized protein n=1 Tax=Caenorhabditis remanei TaxID=31234 RepID=E3MJB6_CAERE|nr:hypothetical protein CRE_19099 [Caenorhabditis remanei]
MEIGNYSPIQTSMQLWIVGMLTEHDLLSRVPNSFPTRSQADTVSHILRKPHFEQMLAANAPSIREFGHVALNNVMTGEEFFTKMRDYCRQNAYTEGYIPL